MQVDTLKGIAKELNLSNTTVSVCLSGKANKYKISSKTEQRVIEYARKHAFCPNQMARALLKKERNTVGIMMDHSYMSYNRYTAIHHAVQKLSQKNIPYAVQDYTQNGFLEQLAKLKGMGVFAVIIIGGHCLTEDVISEVLPYLKNMRIYVIDYRFIEKPKSLDNLYRIGIYRKESYAKMWEYLYSLGHRKIAFESDENITETYNDFVHKHSLTFDKDFLIKAKDVGNFFEYGVACGEKVLKLQKQKGVTAVCLHDDQSAAGLINFLHKHKIQVPDDISVLGFDNIEASPYFQRALTTINVPVCEMVDSAIDSILDDKPLSNNSIFEGELIIRNSTAKCPNR